MLIVFKKKILTLLAFSLKKLGYNEAHKMQVNGAYSLSFYGNIIVTRQTKCVNGILEQK